MSYLLDTPIFIWLMEDSRKIDPSVKNLLKGSTSEVFVSLVTIWELVIKEAKGRLKIPKDFEGGITQAGFKVLPIEVSHVLKVDELPFYKNHQDPFDRLLIAQAKTENLTLITADPKIWQYQVALLKA